MKRKKYIPLAITMLLAVPTFLTSCPEPPHAVSGCDYVQG